ncbi:MAG: ABC transporter ATP-binding protein [archaeon]|nr:MAG: ABC transporter ATP-binding protein [archaeon]
MKQAIQLDKVCKTYGKGHTAVQAVKNAILTVKEGDFLAVVGPSGSGKSTLMNLIGALDVPECGRILLEGLDISHMTESELAQTRGKTIGFVFQQFNLIQTLSAKENVMLPMLFQGYSAGERSDRAELVLKQVGLGHRMHHKPGELSGGEQQRVAIARALANDPKIILADEPTGNLDSKTGKDILKLLQDLNKKGKTIIIITHDQSIAKKAKKIVHIKDGVVK